MIERQTHRRRGVLKYRIEQLHQPQVQAWNLYCRSALLIRPTITAHGDVGQISAGLGKPE